MEWVLVIGGIVGYTVYAIRRATKQHQWQQQITTGETLYANFGWYGLRVTVNAPGASSKGWSKSSLIVTHKRIALYEYPDPQPIFTIMQHELQGFWRLEKYNPAINEIWIHAEIGVTWHILKIREHKYGMQGLVRALKQIASEEQIKAYRRSRPYIHHGPIAAHPATQTLQGAWELAPPVRLYIMPLHLVILAGDEVRHTLPLAEIQNIAALKRMEGGKPDGLVRLTYSDEKLAFAMDTYEAWAAALAEGAKRTLEEPIIRKQKTKDDEDEDAE